MIFFSSSVFMLLLLVHITQNAYGYERTLTTGGVVTGAAAYFPDCAVFLIHSTWTFVVLDSVN